MPTRLASDSLFLLLLVLCLCGSVQVLAEDTGVRAGVTDGCESPDLGAGNQILALCKSSTCSELLSHLCSSSIHYFKKV